MAREAAFHPRHVLTHRARGAFGLLGPVDRGPEPMPRRARRCLAPYEMGIDGRCQVIVNGDRPDVVRQPVFERLAPQTGSHQHPPAAGMEGRLEVLDLVADERGVGRACAEARQGLAQHAGGRLHARRLTLAGATQVAGDAPALGGQDIRQRIVHPVEVVVTHRAPRHRWLVQIATSYPAAVRRAIASAAPAISWSRQAS
jgi:hypothetical protein